MVEDFFWDNFNIVWNCEEYSENNNNEINKIDLYGYDLVNLIVVCIKW